MIGLIRFFGGAGLGGLWISFIGWFLLDAARSSQAQIGMMEMLRGIRVGDVMSRDNVTVDGCSNIQTSRISARPPSRFGFSIGLDCGPRIRTRSRRLLRCSVCTLEPPAGPYGTAINTSRSNELSVSCAA